LTTHGPALQSRAYTPALKGEVLRASR
jgi:hypothetical protein